MLESGASDSAAQCSRRGSGATARPVDHISRSGVGLAWLLRFGEQLQIRERGLTAGQVVSELIKPLTAADKCRYTELMMGDPDPRQQGAVSMGRPFFFVSHAWAQPFGETLAMLERHFSEEQQRLWRRRDGQPLPPLAADEVYVWLDMFAINQHAGAEQQEGDLAALGEVAQDAEETLLVMDNTGSVLSRIWCLYEAWQANRAEDEKLRLLSYGRTFENLEKAFVSLDVTRAQATVRRDRERILQQILNEHDGVIGMTRSLRDALVSGALAQVPRIDDLLWTSDTSPLIVTAARLCVVYGRAPEAEPLFRRDLEGSEGELGNDHPTTLAAVDNLAVFLTTRRQFDEAEGLCRRALAGWEKVRGTAHPNTLAAVGNLASVLHYGKKYDEAEALLVRAVRAKQRVLGADHPSTLASMSHLAVVFKARGKHTEAIPLYRRTLEGYEHVYGPDHPSTLAAINNLSALLKLQGKYGEAEPLYRFIVESRERVLGADHADTLTAVCNLGSMLMPQGKSDEAEALFRRALKGRERVLGSMHKDTVGALNHLASLLASEHRYPEAEPLYRRALEGRELVLGREHPDTLASVKNLALLLKLQSKQAEAEPLYRRLVKGRERLQGGGDPETLAAVDSLAALLVSISKYDEAEAMYRRTLRAREQALGDGHPDTLASVSDLAGVLVSLGKLEEGEVLHRRALEGKEQALGSKHPDTLASVSGLALLLVSRGKYDEAESLYRRALEDREQVLGGSHAETLATVHGLASMLACRCRYEEAEALFRRALDGMEQVLGGSHLDTAATVSGLAGLLLSRGKYDEAEALYRRVLADRKRALGPNHLDVLTSTHDLASLLVSRGKSDEAEALYRRALEGRQRLLGMHLDTLATVSGLATLLVYRGKYDEAEVLYRRALEGREQLLGSNHPDTLACVSSLAGLMGSCGKPELLEVLHTSRPSSLFSGGSSSGGSKTDTVIEGSEQPEAWGFSNALRSRPQRTLQRRARATSERLLGIYQFLNQAPPSAAQSNTRGLWSEERADEAESRYEREMRKRERAGGAFRASEESYINVWSSQKPPQQQPQQQQEQGPQQQQPQQQQGPQGKSDVLDTPLVLMGKSFAVGRTTAATATTAAATVSNRLGVFQHDLVRRSASVLNPPLRQSYNLMSTPLIVSRPGGVGARRPAPPSPSQEPRLRRSDPAPLSAWQVQRGELQPIHAALPTAAAAQGSAGAAAAAIGAGAIGAGAIGAGDDAPLRRPVGKSALCQLLEQQSAAVTGKQRSSSSPMLMGIGVRSLGAAGAGAAGAAGRRPAMQPTSCQASSQAGAAYTLQGRSEALMAIGGRAGGGVVRLPNCFPRSDRSAVVRTAEVA